MTAALVACGALFAVGIVAPSGAQLRAPQPHQPVHDGPAGGTRRARGCILAHQRVRGVHQRVPAEAASPPPRCRCSSRLSCSTSCSRSWSTWCCAIVQMPRCWHRLRRQLGRRAAGRFTGGGCRAACAASDCLPDRDAHRRAWCIGRARDWLQPQYRRGLDGAGRGARDHQTQRRRGRAGARVLVGGRAHRWRAHLHRRAAGSGNCGMGVQRHRSGPDPARRRAAAVLHVWIRLGARLVARHYRRGHRARGSRSCSRATSTWPASWPRWRSLRRSSTSVRSRPTARCCWRM